MKKDTSVIVKIIMLLTLCGIAIALVVLFGGCKDKPAPVPTVPETITAQAKPVEDSLRHEVAILKDSIAYLKTKVQKSEVKKDVAREKKQEASVKVTAAESRGDSLGIINGQREQIAANEQYIKSADEQAASQGEIIVKQDKIITKQISDLAIQDGKFKELATAFTNIQSQYGQAIHDLKKANNKNSILKFFVKVLSITTAAAAAVLAIVFL